MLLQRRICVITQIVEELTQLPPATARPNAQKYLQSRNAKTSVCSMVAIATNGMTGSRPSYHYPALARNADIGMGFPLWGPVVHPFRQKCVHFTEFHLNILCIFFTTYPPPPPKRFWFDSAITYLPKLESLNTCFIPFIPQMRHNSCRKRVCGNAWFSHSWLVIEFQTFNISF